MADLNTESIDDPDWTDEFIDTVHAELVRLDADPSLQMRKGTLEARENTDLPVVFYYVDGEMHHGPQQREGIFCEFSTFHFGIWRATRAGCRRTKNNLLRAIRSKWGGRANMMGEMRFAWVQDSMMGAGRMLEGAIDIASPIFETAEPAPTRTITGQTHETQMNGVVVC